MGERMGERMKEEERERETVLRHGMHACMLGSASLKEEFSAEKDSSTQLESVISWREVPLSEYGLIRSLGKIYCVKL
jgi:hypothetical protein